MLLMTEENAFDRAVADAADREYAAAEDLFREALNTCDRAAQRQAAVGLEAQRQAREWEAIAASMAPGAKREQVKVAAADLGAKGVEYLANGVQLEHAKKQAEAQLAAQEAASRRSAYVTIRGQDINKAETDRAFAASQGQQTFDNELKLQEERRKAADALKPASPDAAILNYALHKEQNLDARYIYDPAAQGDERRLMNADGTPAVAPDAPRATEIGQRMAGMHTLARLAANQRDLIKKYGGENGLTQGEGYKLMRSNQKAIANALRNAEKMGTLDASALALAEEIQGGDPTSYVYDATPALEQMIFQGETNLDSFLKGLGGWRPAKGVSYKLPRFDADSAKPDPDYDAAIKTSPRPSGDVALDSSKASAVRAAMQLEPSAEQAAGIDALTKRITTAKTPEEATDAAKRLVAVVEKADNPAAAAEARRRLLDLAVFGPPALQLTIQDALPPGWKK